MNKQALNSEAFEKNIMNWLKKNKFSGFRSSHSFGGAALGGGIGAGIGAIDAASSDVPPEEKGSEYLKRMGAYGGAGALIGGGLGFRKGTKIRNALADKAMFELKPHISSELERISSLATPQARDLARNEFRTGLHEMVPKITPEEYSSGGRNIFHENKARKMEEKEALKIKGRQQEEQSYKDYLAKSDQMKKDLAERKLQEGEQMKKDLMERERQKAERALQESKKNKKKSPFERLFGKPPETRSNIERIEDFEKGLNESTAPRAKYEAKPLSPTAQALADSRKKVDELSRINRVRPTSDSLLEFEKANAELAKHTQIHELSQAEQTPENIARLKNLINPELKAPDARTANPGDISKYYTDELEKVRGTSGGLESRDIVKSMILATKKQEIAQKAQASMESLAQRRAEALRNYQVTREGSNLMEVDKIDELLMKERANLENALNLKPAPQQTKARKRIRPNPPGGTPPRGRGGRP